MPRNPYGPWDLAQIRSAVAGEDVYSTPIIDGVTYRVLTHPVQRPGDSPVVLQDAYDLTDLQRATASLDQGLVALVPLGVLFAWAGATLLTGRVLGRVRRFALAAERIGAEDLSGRIPVDGNDEFGDLASAFNALLGRLESAFRVQARALEQQRRFTADASHELKTPLTVIKGTTSMALSGGSLEPGVRDSLVEVDRAADSMVGLVQDLLYLARSDAGALGDNRTEVLAAEILQRARSAVAALPGPTIDLVLKDDALSLFGNEGELVRLFGNLFSNARRHTPPDGSIVVRGCERDDWVTIEVADTGCGIPPENVARLGERFFRVDSARSREDGGTGLGLAIAKGIVEAHGGEMKFESVVGKGTTVRVVLPAERQDRGSG